MDFDLILRGGQIIDGTRAPRFQGDVGIQGDRITAIGDLSAASASNTLDISGKIVCPGFVDVHTHSDGWLLRQPNLFAKTSQGFTTEILTLDGIGYAPVLPENVAEWFFYLRALDGLRQDEYLGWESLGDYLDTLDRRTAQNVAVHVPYANVRVNACGWGKGIPDDFQMRQMQKAIRIGMEEGAVGLSTGLDYINQFWASTEELIESCTAMAAQAGLYVTHIRYKKGVLPGIKEAVEIGKRAGVPVHISHLKGNTDAEVQEILRYIDQVARQEVDFSFDVYPYQPGSTMLSYMLPYEVWENGPSAALSRLHDPAILHRFAAGLEAYKLDLEHLRIAWVQSKENAVHQGKLLSEYVQETGLPPAQALANLLLEERLGVLLVIIEGDDVTVRPFLQHDLFMLGSDGIFWADGQVHPRVYGSAPRILGPAVRDWKLFSLEDAVHKMSYVASRRFGLVNRGEIRTGAYADLVVFDPATVTDRATFENPHQPAAGIEQVFVNGQRIIRDGKPVEDFSDDWPGRALRFHCEV